LKQRSKYVAIDFHLAARLIDGYFKDLLEFLIGQIRGLNKKLRDRGIAGGDFSGFYGATRRWHGASKLP
jgi:hypothetical protein